MPFVTPFLGRLLLTYPISAEKKYKIIPISKSQKKRGEKTDVTMETQNQKCV